MLADPSVEKEQRRHQQYYFKGHGPDCLCASSTSPQQRVLDTQHPSGSWQTIAPQLVRSAIGFSLTTTGFSESASDFLSATTNAPSRFSITSTANSFPTCLVSWNHKKSSLTGAQFMVCIRRFGLWFWTHKRKLFVFLSPHWRHLTSRILGTRHGIISRPSALLGTTNRFR